MHERLIQAAIALGLSPRQAETLAYLARGYTMRDTARLMRCGFNTVRTYVTLARLKLGAASVREAAWLVVETMIPD